MTPFGAPSRALTTLDCTGFLNAPTLQVLPFCSLSFLLICLIHHKGPYFGSLLNKGKGPCEGPMGSNLRLGERGALQLHSWSTGSSGFRV